MLRFRLFVATAALALTFPLPATGIQVGVEFTIPNSSLAPGGFPWPWDYGNKPNPVGRAAVSLCGDNYLVAWGGSDGALYATRITIGGDIVDSVPLQLSPTGSAPSVASNGRNCLVVWYSPEHFGVVGTRVSLDGAMLDTPPLVIALGSPPTLPGTISGMRVYTVPKVTSDGVNYWVSYCRLLPGSYPGIHIDLVSADTGLLIGDFGHFYQEYFDQGEWRWSVASNGTDHLLARNERVYGGGANEAWLWSESGGTLVFNVNYARTSSPVSTASDGDGVVVVFNSLGSFHQTPATPPGVKAVYISREDIIVGSKGYGGIEGDNSIVLLDDFDPTSLEFYPEDAVVFEGKQFLAFWLLPGEASRQAFGAVLPSRFLSAPTRQPLFAAAADSPALASSGKGTSLLLYAVATTPDGTMNEVRGRLIVTDSTAPVVTVPSAIAATATTGGGAVVSFEASAVDDYSGAISPTCRPASGSLFALGTTSVNCTALDAAGNMGTASFDVTVTFAWGGVAPPVNPDGSSIFKLGRTVPFTFHLTGASAPIADLTATLTLRKVMDGIYGSVEEATSTSAADYGNLFRYAGGTYIFNLATTSLSAGTYEARIDMRDGIERVVLFSLRQ